MQEVGENVQVQTLLSSSSGWRGRAQQITALQQKVSVSLICRMIDLLVPGVFIPGF